MIGRAGLQSPVAALARALAPARVALVGASDREGSLGQVLWRNLETFTGDVVPVSATSTTVGGQSSAPTLRDAHGPIDLAVVAVPAPQVPRVADDAAAAGVGGMVVLSSGFAEVGPEGRRLQDAVIAAARAGGVRVIGPNCFGVQQCDLRLNASMATGLPQGGGGISLITQSGAYGMAIHTVGLEEHARFATVVSIGNSADVTPAEVLAHLADDEATQVCCVFLEGTPDGRALLDTVRAAAARKPVIVAKTGRSDAGARAAASHTAAMAGRADLWDAALRSVGATVARSGLEMLDAARALAGRAPPAGPRAAIVTNSGGTGVELTDLLAAEGVTVPELSGGLQELLRAHLPPHGSAVNPVDITPAWSRYGELYPEVVDALARSGEVDVVIPVLVHRAADDPAVIEGLREAVARLRLDGITTMVAVCWVAPRAQRAGADDLQRAGIPCFDWPERTARAVAHAVACGRTAGPIAADRGRASPPAADLPAGPPTIDPTPRGPHLPSTPSGAVDPLLAREVLIAHGVSLVPTEATRTPADAVAAAHRLGHPAVVKVADPAIVHRTDADGVRTGLADADAVAAAATELLATSPAGVLVQPQLTGVEVVVGALRDEQLGPMVMVGLGGILVEVLGDVAFTPAPLTRDGAHRLLQQLRGLPLLTGARGSVAADLDALADQICAVGELIAARPEVADVDLNPVLAGPTTAVAVDWTVRTVGFDPTGTGSGPLLHPPTTTKQTPPPS